MYSAETVKNTATVIAPLVLTDGAILTDNIDDYPGGIIIPVDKPYRWTSADVIRKIKFAAVRHFGKKNLKVGHAGTLDPLATGVLLVCIGKATKMAETLQSRDKEYVAGITFGATTPSYDREKDIDRHFPYSHITEESVRKALEGFIGEQDQTAPLFSAKSVDGTRAYEIARKLLKTEGPGSLDETAAALVRTSRIKINTLELLSFDPGKSRSLDCAFGFARDDMKRISAHKNMKQDSALDDADRLESRQQRALLIPSGKPSPKSARINVTDHSGLGYPHAIVRISCSKGTYVRALARDLGEALGSGAFLHSLQRSKSGDFDVRDSLTVENVLEILRQRP